MDGYFFVKLTNKKFKAIFLFKNHKTRKFFVYQPKSNFNA